MNRDSPEPYRVPAASPEKSAKRRPLPDADVVLVLAALSPICLAVIVRTALRGESFGPGPTLCAAFVVFTVWTAVAAWRARG